LNDIDALMSAARRDEDRLRAYRRRLTDHIYGEAQGPAFIAFGISALVLTFATFFLFADADVGDFGDLVYLAGVAVVVGPSYLIARAAERRAEAKMFAKYGRWLND
jgi:hypothetical protein